MKTRSNDIDESLYTQAEWSQRCKYPSRPQPSQGAGLPPSVLVCVPCAGSWVEVNFTVAAIDFPAALPQNPKTLVSCVAGVRCAFVNLSVKSKFTQEKKKEPQAYFMPAVLLINWGIETCAGNHNKENMTEAEILPWKNPHHCLEASTGDLQSGHMTLMTLLNWFRSFEVTVSAKRFNQLVLKPSFTACKFVWQLQFIDILKF